MRKLFNFDKRKSSLIREDLGGYQQYKSVEVDTHPQPFPDKGREKQAFTLAEVLITLAIIGVVAAMTIPTLVANYQQKSWDTAASTFNRRLGEALRVMNSSQTLAGYNTTAEFVNELSKHIKITRTCDSNHLADCFGSEFSTSEDIYKAEELKEAKHLNKGSNYGTETIGVQFADGVTALIAYNPNTVQDPYSNQIVKFTGGKSDVGLGTSALSILYDTSGMKTPNIFTNTKDIRGINVDLRTCTVKTSSGTCIYNLGTSYSPVDCSTDIFYDEDDPSIMTPNEDYKYCGTNTSWRWEDYWAGAQKACAEIGMEVPRIGSWDGDNWVCNTSSAKDTLCAIYNKRNEYGITSGWFWAADEQPVDVRSAFSLKFDSNFVDDYHDKRENLSVLCIGN